MNGEPIGRLAVITSVDNSDLKRGFEDAVKMSRDFYKALDGKTGHITGAEDSLKRVTNQLKVADQHARTFGSSLRGAIVGGLVSGGAIIGAELLGSLGGGLTDIVKDSIQIAASMETTQVAFETMAGSAEKAHDLLKELRVFAKESPLTFQQSSKVAGNLLAAGIKPEQNLPTIRMLSDAARGSPEIIDRLALAYTQVRSKGHLMGQELNQFAETGLPLEQALADVLGKQKDEIRAMVEAGRVGFPDVQKALRKLTDEGGAFYGMTQKYSETFSGQMDSLKDSVQMLKGELGKAIIEEMGLKDMASDAGNFAIRMKDVVNEARPAIRFVGDLVKAGAQLGYLGTRMAGVIGGEQVKSLMDKFPAIGRTVDMIRQGLHDIEAMRFDDQRVRDFGKGLGDSIAAGLDELAKSDAFKNFEKKWNEKVVDPLDKAIKGLETVGNAIGSARDAGRQTGDILKAAAGGNQLGLMLKGYEAIPTDPTPKKSFLKSSDVDFGKLADFIAERGKPPAGQGKYIGGGMFEQPPSSNVDPFATGLRGMMGAAGGSAVPVPVNIVAAAPLEDPLHAMLGGLGGPLQNLATDLAKRAAQRKVEVEQGRDSQIRDKYKPQSQKFSDSIEDLQRGLDQKSITEREHTLAMADLIKGASEVFAQRLPTAQEYGSAELARSLAQATAGVASNSAESILSRMEQIETQQLAAANQLLAMFGTLPKTPPVVKLPAQ